MKFRSTKLAQMPPYQFAQIQKKKREMIKSGADVIDLGVGDPDLPTPDHIINKLAEETRNAANLKYPSFGGCAPFREAVALFYKQTYNVELNPETEVHAVIGSKEGIAHLVPALIDSGDYVLVPDPSYPVYRMATLLAGGQCCSMPLKAENDFKPEFHSIPAPILDRAKLMFLNYPNNPTTATVDIDFFNEAIDFSRENNILAVNDSAYNRMTFNGYIAPSILQADGAKELAVEFGSFSKTYSMTGWRIGYVVGNEHVIKSLSAYKSTIDTGVFTPIQMAAANALNSDQSCVIKYNQTYEQRMETMIEALRSIGIHARRTKGTFFIWARVPEGYTSNQFVTSVLEQTGVIFTPGNVFGPEGEGYFRISLSVPDARLYEVVERISDKLMIQS